MKVLLISSAYPADNQDARGIFIQELARALVREAVEVTVLAPGAPGAPAIETRDGVKVHRAAYWINRWQALALGVGGIVPNLRRRPWLAIQVPFLVGALTWHAARMGRQFSVIHGHWLYPAGLAAVLSGALNKIPVVVTSHGGDLNLARRSTVARWVSRRVAMAATMCVGVSHAMADEFTRLGVTKERVRFIPLGVQQDATPFELTPDHEAQREDFRASTGLRVVYVGSLIPRKSVQTLLEAQSLLQARGSQVASLIVGGGTLETELRSFVKRRAIDKVHFVGPQAPQTIAHWMTAAEVLVLPSLSEGRGLVLAEAMSLGIPVVASDIPGVRELAVEGTTGLRFPAGDVGALASCLQTLADNPELRARLGANGLAFIRGEQLTSRRCAQLHVELYRDCSNPPDARFHNSSHMLAADPGKSPP